MEFIIRDKLIYDSTNIIDIELISIIYDSMNIIDNELVSAHNY